MSRRPKGQRPLLLSVLGLLSLPILAGFAAGLALAFGMGTVVALTGLGGGGGGAAAPPSLYMPPLSIDTATVPKMRVAPAKTFSEKTANSSSTQNNASKTKTSTKKIELYSDTKKTSHKKPITLSGTYLVRDGTLVQVQIYDGTAWQDFPVTTTVVSDRFSTTLISTQTGDVKFRVVDPLTGATSNVVTITVH